MGRLDTGPGYKCPSPTVVLLVTWVQAAMTVLLNTTSAQVILPGQNPVVYLPEQCDAFALNGLRHGMIFSQEDQNRYSPNTDCTVLFSIHPDQSLQFNFLVFELQSKIRGKCVDYVQFFTGEHLDKPLTERLCGKTVPPPIQSNASSVALVFRSNGSHESGGFQVKFQRNRLKQMCGRPDYGGCRNTEVLDVSASRNSTTPYMVMSSGFLIFPAFVVMIIMCIRFL